ncbi:TPA: tail fiber protein [Klebsiella pneumoniae]|nr:tail fiber protein [Klebsiella pneumoniae]
MQPLIPTIGTDDGEFHSGNVLTGTRGTIVTPEWLTNTQAAVRSMQQELTTILTNASLTPDASSVSQLYAAINTMINSYGSALIGVPVPYPLITPPANHLSMNGAAFNVTTFPLLAAVYPSGVLPDLRAGFIRGLDNGKGIDSGRAILSSQAAAAGTITGTCSTLKAIISTDGTPVLDILGLNGVLFNDDPAAQVVTVTPGDTRPLNIAFNYVCRAK